MKKMRNILRFLSLMVCLHAFIFCAQTPTDPSAEIQITEFPIAPEPTRKPQSRLSIIPQKVEKKSPKLVSADDVIIEPEGSILAPPALNQSEIKKGESIIKPQVKENEESLRADPVTTDHEKPAEISPVAEPEAAPVKETKPTVVARGKGWKSRKKTDQPLAVKVPEGQLTTQSAPPLPATEPVTIDPAKPAAISPVAEPASPLVKEKELLPTTELAKSSAASPVVEPVALPVAPTNKSRWRNRSKRNAEQIAADAAGQKNGDSASQPTANQPVSEVLELQEQSVTAQPVAQEIAEQAPGFPVSPAQDGMVQPTANQTAVEISPEVVGQPEQLVTAQAAPTQALTMQEATDRVPAESVAEQPIANKAELALPETPSGKQAPQKLGQQSIRHVGEKQVSAMQPSAGAAQEGIAQPMAEKPDGKQPKKPVAKSSQTLPNGRKRKRVDQAKMAPSLESPAQIPAPELTLPEAPKTDNLPSMADAPVGPARKEFIKEGIEGTLAEKEEKKESREAFEKLAKKGTIHLGQYLEPWKGTDPNETVEMNFDNKELTELLKFLSNNLDVTFILDDSIEPARVDGLQPLAGTKISFKSNTPLTLKQAWEIGLTFLEMAGFSVIPATQPRMYRVTASASRDKASANREPLPTFIGTDPELLPDNDSKIRYVYFADNAELPTIIQIIDAMKSASSGPLIEVPQLKAVIMTDKAANIKSLVRILQEIDKVTLPETLAIIRLRHTDARQVRELYQRLIGKDPSNPIFNPFARQRKPSTTQYFTEATRVFEEPRTNSLIVLGTRENIKRFEDFIIQYIDKTIDLPFSPLHIIQLKYIDATSIAKILNDVIQKFNSDPSNTSAALVGGVRDSNKFFRPSVRVTEEPAGNRLIINADYEEYLKLREIIEKLDVEQPQVAIKVLILNVDLSNTETLGTQLRNKADCCDRTGGLDSILGTNVNFQTSMVGPIVPNEPAPGALPINGANRLLGNLLNLANQCKWSLPFWHWNHVSHTRSRYVWLLGPFTCTRNLHARQRRCKSILSNNT